MSNSTQSTTRCNGANCVEVTRKADGVYVESTIPGNDDVVVFTHAEWDAFIPAVKAGDWDHTLTGVTTGGKSLASA